MLLERPALSDGLILLVESSACIFGSAGAIGAAAFAAFAGAAPALAAAGSPAGRSAHGALPSTSTVSNLMTSTGHPSAAVWIDGVRGLRKSAFIAGGRMMQVSSCTSKTSGQSFSQESHTMHPGAIQTFVTTWYVSAIRNTKPEKDESDASTEYYEVRQTFATDEQT